MGSFGTTQFALTQHSTYPGLESRDKAVAGFEYGYYCYLLWEKESLAAEE